MLEFSNVTFIGAGNLAWHLAPSLDNCGYAVREVFSRETRNARELVKRLYQAKVVDSLDFSESTSNLFIICISDDSIEEVTKEIVLPEKDITLLHTSGSVPLNVLQYTAVVRTGVFYPLQTFSKFRKTNFKEIPILIEGSDSDVEKKLTKIANTISKQVKVVNSSDRKTIHIAAVFASNFTNHMLTLSKEILKEKELDFDILKPLILETVSKGLTIDPENAQTGPARRGDLEILDEHSQYLENSELNEIYRLISQSIMDHYH